MNNRVHDSVVEHAVADERERCAVLAEELAKIHEASAKRVRAEGSFTTHALWPLGKSVTHVRPAWERLAQGHGAISYALRTIARGCRNGWDTRKAEPDPNEQVKPCATCDGSCGSPLSCTRSREP